MTSQRRRAGYQYLPSVGFAALCLGCAVTALPPASPEAVAPPSCGTYTERDRHCSCPADSNYLVAYGRKYCERALAASGFSPAGERWRDATLQCLQNSLAAAANSPTHLFSGCDCGRIKDFAFATHAGCYTQETASFCRLPASDRSLVLSMIDPSDLVSAGGIVQMLQVMTICLGQGTDDAVPRSH